MILYFMILSISSVEWRAAVAKRPPDLERERTRQGEAGIASRFLLFSSSSFSLLPPRLRASA